MRLSVRQIGLPGTRANVVVAWRIVYFSEPPILAPIRPDADRIDNAHVSGRVDSVYRVNG